MTKRDIVREIATEAGVSQSVAQAVVEALFDRLTHALFEDHRVELRTFGVFEIRARAARTARNLATGEPVPVAARNALVFRPGKRLEAGVRQVVLADKAGAANRPGRSRRSGARAAGPRRAVTRPAGQEGKATE